MTLRSVSVSMRPTISLSTIDTQPHSVADLVVDLGLGLDLVDLARGALLLLAKHGLLLLHNVRSAEVVCWHFQCVVVRVLTWVLEVSLIGEQSQSID